jgi:hypothetical protein
VTAEPMPATTGTSQSEGRSFMGAFLQAPKGPSLKHGAIDDTAHHRAAGSIADLTRPVGG